MIYHHVHHTGTLLLPLLGLRLLFWVAVIALVVLAVRYLRRTHSVRVGTGSDPALATLRNRLAAGEITPEEYEKTRTALGAS